MKFKRSIATKIACVVGICVVGARHASAGQILTFEGLKNFEQVDNYFNDGTGSLGSGPGPNYGITFSPYALAYIPGQQTGKVTPFPGDPSPPTVLLTFNTANPFGAGYPTSITMDDSNGFSNGLVFYDIDIGRTGTVQIWSGADGHGTILAQQSLPITSEAFSGPTTLLFPGTAHSVVFTGGNDQLAIDNISFVTSVAEPSTLSSMLIGIGTLFAVYLVRRRKAAAL
jgi:hypothetical protein